MNHSPLSTDDLPLDAIRSTHVAGGESAGNELAAWIKTTALELGFDLAGVTQLAPSNRADYIRDWFSTGQHGAMDYLQCHAPVKIDPQTHWPWVKSVVVLGLNYRPPVSIFTTATVKDEPPTGKIAAYAAGRDYHRVMAGLIKQLAAAITARGTQNFRWVASVDTAPLLEREMAARAGVGWIGKNTMVINPKKGSWFVLGELLTNINLPSDRPMADHCGSCRRCIDACPTDALEPYQMNASRCISYQLIENRGDIDPAYQQPIRDAGYIVGCDICQRVCPHNSKAPAAVNSAWAYPPQADASVSEVLQWDEMTWDQRTRGRATRRVKLAMWKRNAAILSGGCGTPTVNPNL